MKIKITNYNLKKIIRLIKDKNNDFLAEENIKTFDDLVKLAKQYHYEIKWLIISINYFFIMAYIILAISWWAR